MDVQRRDVQIEPTSRNSVPIRDVVLTTCRKQWTIGRCGERWSEISELIARHDDNDNDMDGPGIETPISRAIGTKTKEYKVFRA